MTKIKYEVTLIMKKNVVIKKLDEYSGTGKIGFISGEINNIGTNNCDFSYDNWGSVYGIAVKITSNKVKLGIYDSITKIGRKNDKIQNIGDWNSIGESFYPLYWGADKYMGTRLKAHTKTIKGAGTLQLNQEELNVLQNIEVIYGVIPCTNYKNIEDQLHSSYPCILKTKKEV